ncbi:hypothetical protein [Tumebacillus algifaecis]|nr:hypothetical protein [Tumebacillus algifaecis]
MKRLVLTGLILTVAVTFTGCGGEHTTHADSTHGNHAQHTHK